MIDWLHLLLVGIYAAAAGLLALALARGDERLPRWAIALVGLGLVVHLGAFGAFWSRFGELPLVGLGPALSTLAFLLAGGVLVAAALGHAGRVGLVALPVVVVLTATAGLVGVTPAGEEVTFSGAWFVLHVVCALVGYVGLTLAFAAGLMYLLQFRELKSKRFGAIFRFFPPLEVLDQLGRRGVLLGFPFLSLALLVGWGRALRFGPELGAGNPKVVWGVLSWIVLLAALLARAGGVGRGRRAALVSVLGFVLVVLTYVVLRVQESGAGFL